MSKSIQSRRAWGWTGGAAAAALAVSLAGCGSSVQTLPTIHTAHVEGRQSHEMTRVPAGQTLTVRLPTRGGLNLAWRLTPETASNPMFDFQQRLPQQNDHGAQAQPGEPAKDVFTFRARKTGRTSLVFLFDDLFTSSGSDAAFMTLDVEVYDAKAEFQAALSAAATE
jgi:hypothetical protein